MSGVESNHTNLDIRAHKSADVSRITDVVGTITRLDVVRKCLMARGSELHQFMKPASHAPDTSTSIKISRDYEITFENGFYDDGTGSFEIISTRRSYGEQPSVTMSDAGSEAVVCTDTTLDAEMFVATPQQMITKESTLASHYRQMTDAAFAFLVKHGLDS